MVSGGFSWFPEWLQEVPVGSRMVSRFFLSPLWGSGHQGDYGDVDDDGRDHELFFLVLLLSIFRSILLHLPFLACHLLRLILFLALLFASSHRLLFYLLSLYAYLDSSFLFLRLLLFLLSSLILGFSLFSHPCSSLASYFSPLSSLTSFSASPPRHFQSVLA